MSLKAETIQKMAAIGDSVAIALLSGQRISGTLSELHVNHLIVDGHLINLESVATIQRLAEKQVHQTTKAASEPAPAKKKAVTAKPTPAKKKAAAAKPTPAKKKAAAAKPTPAKKKAAAAKPTPAKKKAAAAKPTPAKKKANASPQSVAANNNTPAKVRSYYLSRVKKVQTASGQTSFNFPSEPPYKKQLATLVRTQPQLAKDLKQIWGLSRQTISKKDPQARARHFQKLFKEVEALLQKEPHNPLLVEHAVHFAIRAEDYDQAESCLLQTLAVRDSAPLWLQLARVYLTAGKTQEALAAFYFAFKQSFPADHKNYWWCFVSLLRQENALHVLFLFLNEELPRVDRLLMATLLFWCHSNSLTDLGLALSTKFLNAELTVWETIDFTAVDRGKTPDAISKAIDTLQQKIQCLKKTAKQKKTTIVVDASAIRKETLFSLNQPQTTGKIRDTAAGQEESSTKSSIEHLQKAVQKLPDTIQGAGEKNAMDAPEVMYAGLENRSRHYELMHKLASNTSTLRIYIDEAWVGSVPGAVRPINEGVIAGIVWFGPHIDTNLLPVVRTHLRTGSLETMKKAMSTLLNCHHCFPFIMPIRLTEGGKCAQHYYELLIRTCIRVLLGWMLPKDFSKQKNIEIFLERFHAVTDTGDITQSLKGYLQAMKDLMPGRFEQWNLQKALYVGKEFEYVPYGDLLAYMSHDHTDKALALGEFSQYKTLPGYLPISIDLSQQLYDIDRLEDQISMDQVLNFISTTHGTQLCRTIMGDLKERLRERKDLQEHLMQALNERFQSKDKDLLQLQILMSAVDELISLGESDMSKQMQLTRFAVNLKHANHHGDPGIALQYREDYYKSRDLLKIHDRELSIKVELNAAVSYANHFQFTEADDCIQAILDDPFFEALAPVMQGRVYSARGQYHAMGGKAQEADASFIKALSLFETADLSAEEYEGECQQTSVYRAINAMDAAFPDLQDYLEKVLPLTADDIRQLSSDTSPKNQYRHHLLIRAIYFVPECQRLRNWYLEKLFSWRCPLQHPWELVSLYRGLILMERPESSARQHAIKQFSHALDICKNETHGATLKLIGAMIATAAYCSTRDRYYFNEAQSLLTKLDHTIPQAADAIARFRTALNAPGNNQIRPVLEALPFNYH